MMSLTSVLHPYNKTGSDGDWWWHIAFMRCNLNKEEAMGGGGKK